MIKFVCFLVLIALVSSVPVERGDEAFKEVEISEQEDNDTDDEWEKIEKLIKEYDIDVNTFQEKMDLYWSEPAQLDTWISIIKNNMPDGTNMDGLKAKYVEILRGTGDDKWSKIWSLHYKFVGDNTVNIAEKIHEFGSQPKHYKKMREIIKELAVENAINSLEEKIKHILGLQ